MLNKEKKDENSIFQRFLTQISVFLLLNMHFLRSQILDT